MKIYTRTGDKGETSLYTGQRLKKSDPVFDAIGTVDECNSVIGVAISHLPKNQQFEPLKEQLLTVQHALFDVGAALATPRHSASEKKIEKTRFDDEEIALLEQWIDAYTAELPELRAFILPGGHTAGACLHHARTICRRAERLILPVDVAANVLIYMNRLSDYLFVASRFVSHTLGSPETSWQQHKLRGTHERT